MRLSAFFITLTIAILNLVNSENVLPNENECGKMNLTQFYNPTNVSDPTEYPWIARVGYNDSGKLFFNAQAVLISRRYLLGAAQNFFTSRPSEFAVFGDWSTSDYIERFYCDKQAVCDHVPIIYSLEKVAVHPNYEWRMKINDLAVLRLSRDVTFNEHISPICMPPPILSSDNYAGQFLPYAGFTIPRHINVEYKFKNLLHVMSASQCREALVKYRFTMTDKNLCGKPILKVAMMTGSPLMGVRLQNGVPHKFYLIGFATSDASDIDILTHVSQYMDYINENLVQ